MERRSGLGRLAQVCLVVAGFAAALGAPALGQSEIGQWWRWEQSLTSQRNYTASSGNPYRDLKLAVTYTDLLYGQPQVTGYGFWDGGTTFKIRTALPVGIWRWQTSCTGSTGGQSCAGDTGLTRTGQFEVLPFTDPIGQTQLHLRGFLKASADGRYVLYGDGITPFFWSADTAWSAPVLSQGTQWSTFVSSRQAKGFTAVLMAPATAYQGFPNPVGLSFQQLAAPQPGKTCDAKAIPNNCSYWLPAYWQKLDQMVEQANNAGLVVVMAGMIDPVDRGALLISGTTYKYPAAEDARTFARNLAARLAGSFVIFSPGFDDRMTEVSAAGESMKTVMDAVIAELRLAVPRHLVVNHLAGRSSTANYSQFQGQLDLQLFQSGHAGNTGVFSTCVSTETAQRCATRRAREMAETFRNLTPVKPNVNGEAGYDYPGDTTKLPPDTPFGVRHTAYLSTLSGAFGATLGVKGIFDWANPTASTVLNSAGTTQMTYLASRFRTRPWQTLVPAYGRILNNGGLQPEQVMVMAATADNRFALAYSPNNLEMEVSTASFPGLSCTSTSWTRIRVDPRGNLSAPIESSNCIDATGRITIKRPNCPDPQNPGINGTCDWVIELENTGASLSANAAAVPPSTSMLVWNKVAEDGATSAILAQLVDSRSEPISDEILVSPAGEVFQKLPRVARDARGSFFVVWQAENLDGHLEGIFARRFDAQGRPLGERFQVNTYTHHDQSDPTVTADSTGNVVVAWMSYGQDGDMGGILAQRFDGEGRPIGDELQVSEKAKGHQGFPLIMADAAGNLVAAWESDTARGRRVMVRLLDREGKSRRPEMRPRATELDLESLVDLAVNPAGDFSVTVARYDSARNPRGQIRQAFTRDGVRSGPEVLVSTD